MYDEIVYVQLTAAKRKLYVHNILGGLLLNIIAGENMTTLLINRVRTMQFSPPIVHGNAKKS